MYEPKTIPSYRCCLVRIVPWEGSFLRVAIPSMSSDCQQLGAPDRSLKAECAVALYCDLR